MSDKLRPSLLNIPEFNSGEMPTPEKLNRAFSLINSALNSLEEVVGDLTGYAGDNAALSNKPLSNLALGRFVGHHGFIQPPAVSNEEFEFQAEIKPGYNEWVLPLYPWGTDASVKLGITGTAYDKDGSLLFQTQVATLTGAGDWRYDSVRNKIISYSVMSSGTASAICTSYVGAEAGQSLGEHWYAGNASLNVMPSFHINPATSITVANSTSTSYDYIVTLHPEKYVQYGPITDVSGSHHDSAALSTIGSSIDANDLGINPIPVLSGSIPQKLPYSLQGYTIGDAIPYPYVNIWRDDTAQTLISSAQYYYRDQTSFFVKGPALDTSGATPYRVVTPGGAPMGAFLEGMIHFARYHRHRGPNAISHKDLANQGYAPSSSLPVAITSDDGNFWNRPTVEPNGYYGNPHPQYLSRFGYDEGHDDSNLNNIFLGWLTFGHQVSNARTAVSADIYNSTNASYGVDFAGLAKISLGKGTNNKLYLDIGPETGLSNVKGIALKTGPGPYSINLDGHSMASLIGEGLNVDLDANSSYVNVQLNGLTSTAKGLDLNWANVVAIGDGLYATASNCDHLSMYVQGTNLTAQAVNCNNCTIQIQGSGGKVVANSLTNCSVDMWHGSLATSTIDIAATDTNTKYYKWDNYFVDAERRSVVKPFYITKFWDVNALGNVATPVTQRYFANVGANVLIQANATNDLGYILEMEDDCHIHNLQLDLVYQTATMSLRYCGADGLITEATSTVLSPSDGVSTSTVSWAFATGIGVVGDRFPALAGNAVSLQLLVQHGGGSALQTMGGKYEYYRMRG